VARAYLDKLDDMATAIAMRSILQRNDKRRAYLGLHKKRQKIASSGKVRRHIKAEADAARRSGFIVAPRSLGLQSKISRRLTLEFIRLITDKIMRRPITIDFTHTLVMYPTGVLLLTAELDRLHRHLKSAFSVTILVEAGSINEQVLDQVGISALCGRSDATDPETLDESVRHWRYATGERMNDAPGRALERFEGRLSDAIQTGMWKGLSEAVVNSVQHAYLAERNDGIAGCTQPRWWMFSQVREGDLTVAVCDLGIGIPRSLPMVWGAPRVADLLSRFGLVRPDLAAVRAALEIGATRTSEENRGRGLPQIWLEMKGLGNARTLLLSNKALLSWNGEIARERAVEFDDSILGTMIVWTVPMAEVSKDG
jgi:hypothetical protein